MKEEHAFASPCLPCNSLPFLTRLREILDESGTNSLQSVKDTDAGMKAQACLWVLNAQLYGQLATVDLFVEWDELYKAMIAGKLGEPVTS